jgi:FkbM family methyltransferase
VSIRSLLKRLDRFVRNTDQVRTERFRWHVFPLLGRLTPFVGVERDGVRYIVSTSERGGVSYGTFVSGSFETETLRRMLAALASRGITTVRGMTVLEVGANIGTETVSLLSRHGVERVIAFEPDAENARLLRANLALNGLHDCADVHELALSDVDAMLVLERSEDNCGDHRIRVIDAGQETPSQGRYNEGDRATVPVAARRLDSLVQSGEVDLDAIDLVWMDAQGHEGHVLTGGRSLIGAGVPVLTEYWPYGLRRAGGLDRFHALVSEGYETVVDLRSNRDEPAVTLPASQVSQLAERYSGEFGDYSDLLLLAS